MHLASGVDHTSPRIVAHPRCTHMVPNPAVWDFLLTGGGFVGAGLDVASVAQQPHLFRDDCLYALKCTPNERSHLPFQLHAREIEFVKFCIEGNSAFRIRLLFEDSVKVIMPRAPA